MKEKPLRTAMDIFKSLPEGTRVQLIGNVFVMEPTPVFNHQDVSTSVGNSIYNFVKQQDLGKVVFAPVDGYLDQENAFQPDILFISNERLNIIKKNGLHGAPDLIVEILSPSTSKYDQNEKKQVYERCGVKEYWLIDPDTREVQGYKLSKGGFEAFSPAGGLICSGLLGETFKF